MDDQTAGRNLVWFLKERAGKHLRGVLLYTEDGYEMLYLRDDLRNARLKSEVDSIVSRLREGSKETEEAVFPFGDFHGSVRCFDDATFLHFPLDSAGVAVSLDPEATTDLNTFAGKCLEQIHENPPV
jgi:hypothetical protein